MEITIKFLKTAQVAVIASDDNEMLKVFINFIAGYGYTVSDCLSYDCANGSNELKFEILNKIKELKERNSNCIIPIEFLNRNRLTVALLRSLFLRIPENDKPDIQMFNLHYFASELRLECKFGENAGRYIVYDYNKTTGQFTEKVYE